LLFTAIPLLTWNPHYGKFWIQPLACFALLLAIAFRHFSEMSGRVLVVARVAGFLFLVGAACNLQDALRQHFHQNFEFEEARKVTRYVGAKDLVILDRGADSVSVMYGYLWADDNQFFAFIDQAVVNRDGVLQLMGDAIHKTQAAGGKVFFLGVVDVPKPTWDVFLDKRCGVPYGSLDRYRLAVLPKAQFKSRTGVASLWELPFPTTQDSKPSASAEHPLADWNATQVSVNFHWAHEVFFHPFAQWPSTITPL